jgi:sugar phosphate permease
VETAFMLFYAFGSFSAGALGDVYTAPTIIAAGLIGSGICVMLLVLFIWSDIANTSTTSIAQLLPLGVWLIHGLMQSTGGPANTSIMSNWFGSKNRGYIFGTWTCHQYVGNITAALVAGVVLSIQSVPWTVALIIPALANICWGLVCMFFLPERPEDLAEVRKNRIRSHSSTSEFAPLVSSAVPEGPSISFIDAIRIPNVLGYSLGFGFFKFINYVIFFWLPFYLAQSFEPRISNLVSILYDVGMIPGGILVGLISDLFGGRRACVIATFTVTLVPFLLLFAEYGTLTAPLDTLPTAAILVMLVLMGCLIGGPINIITSAVAVDLSEQPKISGRSDLMTVTGIINGFGSIMASLGLLFVGPIQVKYGWKIVWQLLALCSIIGTLLLGPIIWKELTTPIEEADDAEQPLQSALKNTSNSSGNSSEEAYLQFKGRPNSNYRSV